jgi:hypothetical protein
VTPLPAPAPGAQAAPMAEMPGVGRYRLYKSLVNHPAPDAAAAPGAGDGSTTGPGGPARH